MMERGHSLRARTTLISAQYTVIRAARYIHATNPSTGANNVPYTESLCRKWCTR